MTKSETMRAAGELGLSVAEHTVDASQRTAQRTVTRVDLAEAVYRCVGLSRKESAILVESVLDELADALIGGESVKLSSFGRFLVRAKSERIGRNPKTGIEVPITQRRVMVFKPSNVLKARINGLVVADDEDD
ncbi:MAG TPA: integration host factor subunit alpha [Methylocella sp.]|jgi:integration host factor subunit alpha|nr:integration host factor subunit alpha [Methylocella sp.]